MVFAKNRNYLYKHCLNRGIEAKIHYPIPIYKQKALKKISRNKYWGGLGFIPIIVCTDNYVIDEIKHKQYGIMGALPLPFFGNSFYP